MRILNIDRKTNFLEIVPENLDDLWHLEKILEAGDVVSGSSYRKIKGKNEGDESQKIKLRLKIQVENIEFDKFFGLRINGIILEGTPEEFIELKAHHSLEVEIGTKIKIEKIELKNYQIERLEKAKKSSIRNAILLVVLDDEIALFALLKDFGVEEKCAIKSKKQGKQFDESDLIEKGYFNELLKKIQEIKPEKVIIAGPGFAKENFEKFLKEKNTKGIEFFFHSINSVGVTGLQELVKSHAIDSIVEEMEVVKEAKLLEKFLEFLGRNEKLAFYGLNDAKNAANFGAIELLLVSDKALSDKLKRLDLEKLMDLVEKSRGKVEIINSETDAGKKLEAISGIAGILRYAIN